MKTIVRTLLLLLSINYGYSDDLANYHKLHTSNLYFTIDKNNYALRLGISFNVELEKLYFKRSSDLPVIKGKFTIYNIKGKAEELNPMTFNIRDNMFTDLYGMDESIFNPDIKGVIGINLVTRKENEFLQKGKYVVIPEIYVLKDIPQDLEHFISIFERESAKSKFWP